MMCERDFVHSRTITSRGANCRVNVTMPLKAPRVGVKESRSGIMDARLLLFLRQKQATNKYPAYGDRNSENL